jgi:hypothetical protein
MAMATTFAPLPEAEQSAQLRKAVIAFANLVSQLPIAMPRPCPKFNLGRPKLFRAPVASPPCNRNTVCAISCFLSPSLPPSALSQRSLYSAPKSRLGTQERHRQLNVFDERPRRQDCRRSGMETFAQLKSSGPPKLMPAMRRCQQAEATETLAEISWERVKLSLVRPTPLTECLYLSARYTKTTLGRSEAIL